MTKFQEVELGGKVMPMAVTPDGRFLYAGIRSRPFAIACFAIDPADGTLRLVGKSSAPESLVYLRTDRTGRHLLGACNPVDDLTRSTGLACTFPIDAHGLVGPVRSILRTAPKLHAMMIDPANRFVLAPCCIGDIITRYAFDPATGNISPDGLAPVIVLPKSGPRHPQFHPSADFFYLLTEYDASVVVYRWNAARGSLNELQIIGASPPGSSLDSSWRGGWRGADLHFTPDGRWLYASVRNTNTIAAFSADPATGLLTPAGHSFDCCRAAQFLHSSAGTLSVRGRDHRKLPDGLFGRSAGRSADAHEGPCDGRRSELGAMRRAAVMP